MGFGPFIFGVLKMENQLTKEQAQKSLEVELWNENYLKEELEKLMVKVNTNKFVIEKLKEVLNG